jgi:NADH-quinone oxidoreductase subunit H
MVLLIVSTILKIVFVLAILLTVAPVLVWAERRQSSMFQDRVGPHRAGVPLPEWLAEGIRGPAVYGARIVATLSAVVGIAFFLLGVFGFLVGETGVVGGRLTGLQATSWGFGLAFVFLLSTLFHQAAAWLLRNSVDEYDRLTVFGLIHPVADAAKMIFKEDFVPPRADKFLYSAAPIIATIPAFATFAVIPFGPDLYWGGGSSAVGYLFDIIPAGASLPGARVVPMQVASVNVGILYIFAIAGTGIVGAAIAGYSSDNKYSLLGGIRAASQMVSYEVTLGLTLVGCFMVYNTLLLDEMVEWQRQNLWGFIVQPLALVLFFFAAIAEMKRVPFDAPEGESEIVAGYFLEYAGMKFGLFMMGEFLEHCVSAGIIVTLFFGGWHIPFLHADGFHFPWLGYDLLLPHIVVVLLGVTAFLLKMFLVIFLFLQVRWTLPRFRYDQIMQLCWKIILPLSLANILVTGLVILILE